MSKNYKFKTNPALPSQEDMSRHKDFDALLKRYESEPRERGARIRRLRLVYISSAAAAAVAVLVFLLGGVFSAPEAPQLSTDAYFEQQPFAQPPIQSLAAPAFANFRVKTEEGGVYEYSSGSKLVVPAAAFANDYGRLIEGEVDVYYREMHDFVDFFTAGIPMQYDSAGNRFALESSGMIELYAEQNGERVQLAPGKTIDLELVSEIMVPGLMSDTPPQYNVYRLDTIMENWRYQSQNRMTFLGEGVVDPEDPLRQPKQAMMEKLRAIERDKQESLQSLESRIPRPVKPLRPQPAQGDLPTLELDFLDGELQIEDTEKGRVRKELAQLQRMYENVIWKIMPSSPAFDERAFGVAWEAVKIRPINERDYELTLVHPQNELTLIVSPMLFGEDYQNALDRYSLELQEYQAAMEAREAELKEARAAILAESEAKRSAVAEAYDARLDTLLAGGAKAGADPYLVRRRVVNRFNADKLGVWNCARPVRVEQQPLNVAFKDQHGATYDRHTAYLADYGRNTLYRFYTGGETWPVISTSARTLLWVVTDDSRLAVLPPEQRQALNPKKRTLRLNLLDRPVDREADVRDLLHF